MIIKRPVKRHSLAKAGEPCNSFRTKGGRDNNKTSCEEINVTSNVRQSHTYIYVYTAEKFTERQIMHFLTCYISPVKRNIFRILEYDSREREEIDKIFPTQPPSPLRLLLDISQNIQRASFLMQKIETVDPDDLSTPWKIIEIPARTTLQRIRRPFDPLPSAGDRET